ncbi:hypothetical protein LN042_06055 [Kitasatospora sp. RB6PN24]|uniref:hypothetical protein n=1 Tax=Kitasatospora humi TaxID=2893891 RepID=UPI001E5F96D2|nr:hypothetical protein [Kitasatospora humi]MCC9306675.1 hypothetical protein [Kitasatospora humi]
MRESGERLVKAGAVVFIVGALATVVTFIPLFFHLTPLPTPAYFASMLMPLGFLLALVGLFGSARAQRRRADAAEPAAAGQSTGAGSAAR